MRRISVLIADRHPVVREGLASALGKQPDFQILASCGDEISCIEAIRNLAPHIAILDIGMAGLAGPEMLSLASSGRCSTKLVFFSASVEESRLVTAAWGGACSVILRDVTMARLLRSLREIADGRIVLPLSVSDQAERQKQNGAAALTNLTDRERQIIRLVSEGLSNKEIGRRLRISDGTIKVHLHHIFQKLDVSNRTVLAALVISQSEGAGTSVVESESRTLRDNRRN